MVVVIVNKPLLPTQIGIAIQVSLTSLNRYSLKFSVFSDQLQSNWRKQKHFLAT